MDQTDIELAFTVVTGIINVLALGLDGRGAGSAEWRKELAASADVGVAALGGPEVRSGIDAEQREFLVVLIGLVERALRRVVSDVVCFSLSGLGRPLT
jgi:hypothetical protein